MQVRSTMLLLYPLAFAGSILTAAERPWWNPKWRYRVTVERPAPWRDRRIVPVEIEIDLQKLLRASNEPGDVDDTSVIVVDTADGERVPAVYRSAHEPGSPTTASGRLFWLAKGRPNQMGRYDIYFETRERQVQVEALPEAEGLSRNLIRDEDFETLRDANPVWRAAPAELLSTGAWSHGTGKGSLRVCIDESTPEDCSRLVSLAQTIDVSAYAGMAMRFGCTLQAERALYGVPMTIELRQFRQDGSSIPECAVEPRWLSLELAQGHLVRFDEMGRFSGDAATLEVVIRCRLSVRDADTAGRVDGVESFITLWLDNVTVRAGEQWPWPPLTHAGFVEGAFPGRAVNAALEFNGQRRLMFNGASEGTLTMAAASTPDSVHWGLSAGTVEFWCKPLWGENDRHEHVLFEGLAYGHRTQSRWRRTADGQLEFSIWDSDRRSHTVKGPATMKPGQWYHLAATWDFAAAEMKLFVNGRGVAAVAELAEGPWPFSLIAENAALKAGLGIGQDDRRSLPMQAFIGGRKTWSADHSAEAVMDEFRVSDCVRYQEAFTPASQPFEVDDRTRALFHFDYESNGEHDADDRFVRGHLACELPPQSDSVTLTLRQDQGKLIDRRVLVAPHGSAEEFEENRAETRMQVTRPLVAFPDPRMIDFRDRHVSTVVTSIGDTIAVDTAGDDAPWMGHVTFEIEDQSNPSQTRLPRWRANDNVVPFSVQSLNETLAQNALDDADRAFQVFRYALATTNYFDAHYCETLPCGRHRDRVAYTLIKALNIYPMDQCGPMNHMLRKLFLSAGISSTNASGTHHQFEQAFYDGAMRLYDLSGRLYWLDRDNRTVISRRQLEEDPWLKLRQGGDANAWLRGRSCRATFGTAVRPHSMDFPIRNGERISICWHNEGRWFELTGARKPVPLAKIPPFFGNGAIEFLAQGASPALTLHNAEFTDGKTGEIAPIDSERPASVTYDVLCPYIFSDAVAGVAWAASRPDAIELSVSVDEGRTWVPIRKSNDPSGQISARLTEFVSARYAYRTRITMAPGTNVRLRDFRVRTVFVASPWALPGSLSPGRNTVHFVGGPVDTPVKTSCHWIERHTSDWGVATNALGFLHDSGRMYRQVILAATSKPFSLRARLLGHPPLSIGDSEDAIILENVPPEWSVDGPVSSEADVTERQWQIEPRKATLGEMAHLVLRVADNDRQRRVPVAVLLADPALVCEAEEAAEIAGGAVALMEEAASGGKIVSFRDTGSLSFPLNAGEPGAYALWLRAKWDQDSSTRMTLALNELEAREIRAAAMIGFTDWTAKYQAHTKMFAHFGEQYSHWSWYRVPDVDLPAGEGHLQIHAARGAHVDAVLLLPQNPAVDRAAMNLFMNWNYAPERNPF